MNEEAGFIAALAADPDDRTTQLAFADWLGERDDPRAEGLRLLLAPEPNWRRIAALESPDRAVRAWVGKCKCVRGSVVRLDSGPFAGHVGQIVAIYPHGPAHILVAVRVLWLGGLIDAEVDSATVLRLSP